jgi:hypothetical protein
MERHRTPGRPLRRTTTASLIPHRQPQNQQNIAHHGVVQLRNPTAGRAYFDSKKAAGKTSMESMRALKRRLSNVVYARMLADQKRREATDPGGHSGTTLQSSVTGLTPDTGPSDKPQPEPAASSAYPHHNHPLTSRGAMSVLRQARHRPPDSR